MSDRSERPSNPQEMLERLQQMEAEAKETLRKYDEMSQRLGADAVEVYSEDGLIAVKLDADGRVDQIKIDESAMRFKQSLGPTIISLIQEATAAYGLKMAEMAQELVGDKLDVAELMGRYMPDDMRERAQGHLDRRRD